MGGVNCTNAEFLPDPSSIRKAVVELASDCKRLDLAVAFIGSEWERLIGNYLGPIRCWTSGLWSRLVSRTGLTALRSTLPISKPVGNSQQSMASHCVLLTVPFGNGRKSTNLKTEKVVVIGKSNGWNVAI